ncbi:MAG: hypothetical protein GY719_14175 [bacterium]|nr:hypothetical protein [bacterium]
MQHLEVDRIVVDRQDAGRAGGSWRCRRRAGGQRRLEAQLTAVELDQLPGQDVKKPRSEDRGSSSF